MTKEDHEKLLRERDGYKAQALKKQAKKELESENDSKGADGTAPDDEKVKELVKQGLEEYSSSTKKALQSRAQEGFLREHPELVENEALHDEVLSHLNLRSEDRKSTRLNSSHIPLSRMPSSA